MIDVIYLTGGIGKRANLGYPKQYARLKGKPIMIYGLETLSKIEEIGNILISCDTDNSHVIDIISNYDFDNIVLSKSKETRQESIYNELKHINTNQVLICESVRPFMSEKLVRKVINMDSDCVIPIDYSLATVVDILGNTFERQDIGCVQMPQKYNTEKLLKVHEFMNAKNETCTDDYDLISKYRFMHGEKSFSQFPFNRRVVFHGEIENIKITYPIDLKIAEAILNYMEGGFLE